MFAAQNGHVEIVELLIKEGANTDIQEIMMVYQP